MISVRAKLEIKDQAIYVALNELVMVVCWVSKFVLLALVLYYEWNKIRLKIQTKSLLNDMYQIIWYCITSRCEQQYTSYKNWNHPVATFEFVIDLLGISTLLCIWKFMYCVCYIVCREFAAPYFIYKKIQKTGKERGFKEKWIIFT